MWVGIGFLILSVITAIIMAIVYKNVGTAPKRKTKAAKSKDGEEIEYSMDKKELKALEKMLGIKKVENNMVTLQDSNIRSIMSISSPDFELLTQEEQSIFENALMQCALSLSFPTQFFTTTIKIETKEPVKIIENFIKQEEEMDLSILKNYAQRLKEQLEHIENERGVHVRQSFCIAGTDVVTDDKRMLMELRNRADTIVSGLTAARMKVNIMDTKRIAQLLSDYFNKFSNTNLENMVNNGVLEPYSDGLGVVIYNVEEKGSKE